MTFQARRRRPRRRGPLPGLLALIGVAMIVAGCGGPPPETATGPPAAAVAVNPEPTSTAEPVAASVPISVATVAPAAVVEGVAVSGEPGGYTFSVTIRSPDTGCEQYADWWEVISAEGDLVYRRVLLHSHVGEQPFTRSGGPIEAGPATELIVRGHMNGGGYGPGMRGTAEGGFGPADLPADFARSVELAPPLPQSCAG